MVYPTFCDHGSLYDTRDFCPDDGEPFTNDAWNEFFYDPELMPPEIRGTPQAHEWADARKAELPAIRRAVPELPPPGDDPHLVDGSRVGIFRRTLTHENDRSGGRR